MSRQQAIDIMRDVYMTRAQREAYEYLIAMPDDTAEPVDVQYKAFKKFDDGEISIVWMTESDLDVSYGWEKCLPEEKRNLYAHPPKDTAERDALVARIDTWWLLGRVAEDTSDLVRDLRAYLTRDHIPDAGKKVGA